MGQSGLVWPGAKQPKHSLSDIQCEVVVWLASLQTLEAGSLERLPLELG